MSRTQQMTLTQALAEATALDKQIRDKTYGLILVGVTQGSNEKPTDRRYSTKEQMETKIKADYQSINDLIRRREAIKSALAKANHETKVKVGEQEMSIADAILLKASVTYRKGILEQMRLQVTNAARAIEKADEALRAQQEKAVQSMIAQKQGQELKPETIAAVRKDLANDYEPKMLDPLAVAKQIEQDEQYLAQLGTDLDHRLSTINSTTLVTVSW